MKNREVVRQTQSLQALVKKSQVATGGDIEIQAHWAKYLCVLAAGLLENTLVELYGDYCRKAASPAVANFSVAALGRIQNPKSQAFIDVSAAFNKAWGTALESFIEEDGRKEAINSIMANRHLIAHGRSSGITIARVSEYLGKVLDVFEFVEKQCK